jgi:hypothetical protein
MKITHFKSRALYLGKDMSTVQELWTPNNKMEIIDESGNVMRIKYLLLFEKVAGLGPVEVFLSNEHFVKLSRNIFYKKGKLVNNIMYLAKAINTWKNEIGNKIYFLPPDNEDKVESVKKYTDNKIQDCMDVLLNIHGSLAEMKTSVQDIFGSIVLTDTIEDLIIDSKICLPLMEDMKKIFCEDIDSEKIFEEPTKSKLETVNNIKLGERLDIDNAESPLLLSMSTELQD